MKNSTIKNLFYEKVGTINSIKSNKKCLKLSSKVIKLEKEILEMLDFKTKALFETYLELETNYLSEVIDFYYIEGFKVGLGIGFECNKQKSCD